MSYWGLIWSGLWRKPARTWLTLLSIGVAFLLFGLLQGINTSFKQLIDTSRLDVLNTASPAGLPLPLSDFSQIAAVRGVTRVSYNSTLIGWYQSIDNVIIGIPVDPDFFGFNTEFTVLPDQLAAFKRTRTGALMTAALGRVRHWKVGDHVPFHSINGPKKDGSPDWQFDIVGVFDIPNNPVREQALLLINYDYFDSARASNNGTADTYSERIGDPSKAARIGAAIDALFANSPNPTHTVTERESTQAQLAQIGNLDFFVNAIVAATFFTLLLLTGNTMMRAFRERIREFAVMKTLGFLDATIAALLIAEALLLCLSAAALGLMGALALLPYVSRATNGQMPGVYLPAVTFWLGIAAAVVLALASALPAAWRAQRLTITRALAA